MINRFLTLFTLKGLIALSLFGVGILPLIGMVSINLPTITQKLEQLTELERVNDLEQQVDFLETAIEHRKANLRTLTALPGTVALFSDPATRTLDAKKIQKRMTSMFNRWLPADLGVKAITLTDQAGQVLSNWEMDSNKVLKLNPLSNPTLPTPGLQKWHEESMASSFGRVYVAGIEQEFVNQEKQHAHFPKIILGIPGKNNTGAYGGAIFMKISLASFVQSFPYDFIATGTGKILHRSEADHHNQGTQDHAHTTSTTSPETFPELLSVDINKSHLILPGEDGKKIAFVKIINDLHPEHTLWLAHPMDMGKLETWLHNFHLRFIVILSFLILLVLVLAMTFASRLERLHRELVAGLSRLIQEKEPILLNWSYPTELKELGQDLQTLSQSLINSDDNLRQSETFLKNIFDGIQDGISVHDQNFTILKTNHCIEKWFENKLPLVGKKCYEVFHNRQDPCESCPTHMALDQNVLQRCEMPCHIPDDKDKWLEVFAYPLNNSNTGNRQVVEFIRDITAQKQAESQRDNLLNQLAFSQKMEAVGTLAGGVAHDFNNILTAINGYAEICLKQISQEDPIRRKIKIILESGQRAARLTQQLLTFSRKQIVTPQDIDVNQSLQDINRMLIRVLGEDIDMTINCSADLWHIQADQTQFEQVIVNLAVNARDAMLQGGKLTFETQNIILDQAYAERHYGIAAGHYVLLTISDNGQGMDKETLAKIFEPFFTTKEKGKGTGLGLATVYGIIKQNNGEILVYSEPGKGTCFKIYLPQHIEKSLPSRTQAAPTETGITMGNETILLVEDDEIVRTMTVEVLISQGYSVLEATDGIEALQTCQRYHGNIDLLLTDVVMPKMGGAELAPRVKKLRPEIKILFMSGYTDDAIIRHGILQENVHFLPKPVSPTTLSKRLRAIFDHPSS